MTDQSNDSYQVHLGNTVLIGFAYKALVMDLLEDHGDSEGATLPKSPFLYASQVAIAVSLELDVQLAGSLASQGASSLHQLLLLIATGVRY